MESMSIILDPKEYGKKELRAIERRYTVIKEPDTYNESSQIYRCYIKLKRSLVIPMRNWDEYEPGTHPNGEADDFPKISKDVKFRMDLLTKDTDPQKRNRDQNVVVKKAWNSLEKRGTVLLSCHTGFGKTATAIYLGVKTRLKILILCHLSIVQDQWPEAFNTFCKCKVKIQILKGKNCKLDPDADVYMVGVVKASKMTEDDFLQIGTVIVDEAHLLSVKLTTDVLLKLHPRYLIGLTATIDNSTGGIDIWKGYFGSPKDFIVRLEKKDFTVIKIKTRYKPIIEYMNVHGKSVVNWNKVVESIEENPERHKEIAKLIKKYKDKEKMIVLCNRNMLVDGISEKLDGMGVSHEKLYKNKTKWDKTNKVLLCGMKKGGAGMDDKYLTMGIIASSTKDVRQYEGRIRTTNNTIYHFVDNYNTFETHWKLCKAWYISKGAVIVGDNSSSISSSSSTPVRRFKLSQ